MDGNHGWTGNLQFLGCSFAESFPNVIFVQLLKGGPYTFSVSISLRWI